MTSPSPLPRRPAVPHHRGTRLRLPQHPHAPDPSDLDAVRRWVGAQVRPTAIDLFCGAGGLSLGLRRAGFSVLAGADSDVWAVESHAANLGALGWAGDLSDPGEFLEHLDGWGIERVDLVAGGVPCQPFSRAGQSKLRSLVDEGRRGGNDARAHLWVSFVAVVKRLRPRAVLVENVPGLPAWDDGAVLLGLLESLREQGYSVDARVLHGSEHGVPQHRSRLFIVGVDDGREMHWPTPCASPVSLRDAIGDMPIVPGGQRSERLPYRGPQTAFQRVMREGMPIEHEHAVLDHITRAVRADDLEAYRLLGEGQTYRNVPSRLRRYRSDIFTDKYKRLEWDGLSRSITAHIAKDGYWYIHPEQHRTLSLREAARIQTFPDWYRFAGEPSHRLRQIGNAVPPILAEAVGRGMRDALDARARRRTAETGTLRARLLAWTAGRPQRHPWRPSGDPWLVLAAELCLARLRPDDVPAAFRALARIAPTPGHLAAGGPPVLAELQAVGVRTRGALAVQAAGDLVERFEGRVPEDELALRSVPGVGDYVAQAVRCFGFGRRAVLLETGTSRIISRLHDRDATARWQLRLDLHRVAGAAGPDAMFNGALLELGDVVCRPKAPRCEKCPIQELCATGGDANAPEQMELGAA